MNSSPARAGRAPHVRPSPGPPSWAVPMSAERLEPPNPHGRYRYGSWRGGPDPLAPPFDVRAAVDKIGADLLSAGNLRDSLRELLRREVLDAQFAGMKQALESPDPEAMERVKDMLADLNNLLAAHARNEDTTDAFRDFMAKHGEFFPEQPEDVEELIDILARRQAAAQRMLASLSPEQREQLGQLMSQALSDADLAAQMAQLSDNLRSLRPGLDRESPSGMRPGGESLGYSEAVEAVAELADLEALQAQLAQSEMGSTLDDVDVDLLEQRLGAEAARDFRALRDLERELEQQGYLSRGEDGLRLTPRAVRRLGQTALRRVFAQLAAAGHGDHDDRRTGGGGVPPGSNR